MKLMFASDIHGSAFSCRKMKEIYVREKAERLILLGDLLYHGPRNDLPREYNPKEVMSILNGMREELLCVRGNCDAEVDQMVLDFPIMADYMTMFVDGHMFFITHGHIHNTENMPPLKAGDLLIHGHTHVLKAEAVGPFTYLNPGSVSIPKEGNPPSYMVYEKKDGCAGEFLIKSMDGEILQKHIVEN